eukprot:jgi/Chrpa1/28088/Chrysochromulina_OHIO_Genome00017432-RA
MAMINKFVASRHRYTFADVVDRARSQFLDDRARAAGAQHGQFYTDAAMVTRAALRVEPAVIEAIDHAWQCIQAARINTAVAAQEQSPGNPAFRIIPLSDPIRSGDNDHMSRTAYRTMIRKLYLVTHEMSSDVRIDAQEVRTSIDEDWQRDSGGKGKLSRAAFHRCWFELCDLHTRSIEGNEYVRWILRVLRRLLSYAGDAQLVPAPGEPIELHKVAWRSDSSLLDALQRRATIGNADPPGEEDLLRVKAVADLAELLRAKAAAALLSKKAAAHPHWKNAAASDAGAPPAAVFAASTAAPAITMAVAPTPAGLGIVGAGYSPMLARVARAHQFKAGRQSWEAAIAGDQAEAEVALLAEQHSQQLSRLAEGPWGMGDVQLYRGVAERHLLATAPSTRLADNDRSLWHARPTKATMGTQKEAILGMFEWVFLIIFTLELLSKALAYSLFWHREAYLRDPWCQLDFLVVSLAWLPILFPSMGNYSALRAFRALRPLRALKRVPGMPLLVQWILSVLPKMGNVFALGGFVFLIFGIVGMELFKGSLHYRCALPGFEETPGHPISDVRRRLLEARVASDAGVSDIDQTAWDTGIPCNSHLDDAQQCPDGSSCAYFDKDPNDGLTSFDSVAIFFITFFQSITCDFWATSMYSLMAAFSPWVWMYFVLIIMVVGFFVINLFLAVIYLEYSDTRAQIKLERSSTAQPASSVRTQSSARSTDTALGADALGADGSEETSSDSVLVDRSAGKEEPATLLAGESVLSDGTTKPPRSFSGNCADCSLDGPCRRPFRVIANAEWLNHTSTALVLVNMVLMCMAYEGMSEEYAADLE